MNKLIKVLWITLFIGITSSALAGPNQDIGTVVGGIAGGIIGNNLGHGSGRAAATIGGAVVGSVVGNQMGYAADRQYHGPQYRYNRWVEGPYPRYYRRPIYRNTFVGRNGRLCRRTVVINAYGNRVYRTYCCNHITPRGYCTRWVRVY